MNDQWWPSAVVLYCGDAAASAGRPFTETASLVRTTVLQWQEQQLDLLNGILDTLNSVEHPDRGDLAVLFF